MTTENDPKNVMDGPESLVHILPHLFGYHPESAVVLSGFTAEGKPVHFTRTSLPADTSDWQVTVQDLFDFQQEKVSEGTATVVGLVAWICPDPADPLYGEQSMVRHQILAGLLGMTAAHNGADLREVVYVTRDRFWLMSTDALGEGRPISSPPAEFDATALPRSSEVRAALAPVTGDRARAIAKAVDVVLGEADVQIRTSGHAAVANDAAALVRRTVRDLADGSTTVEQIPDHTAARLLVGLQYSFVAGVAMELCEDHELAVARDLWLHLARLCPDEVNWCVVEPTVLYAATSWGLGQRGIARLAMQAVELLVRDYSLINLLAHAMNVERSYEGFRARLLASRATRGHSITG